MHRGRPCKYPWRTIAVGESFLAIGRDAQSMCHDARLYHRHIRIKTKTVVIKGQRACRVWRIA